MQPIPVYNEVVESQDSARIFILKVYSWMTIGLFITAVVSYAPIFLLGENKLIELISENIFIFYGLLIFELILVFGLSAAINKIPAILAYGIFLFYAFLNGVTLCTVFLIYTGSSVLSTFLVCSMMFAGTSVLGFITKMDLTKFGGFFMMALIGLIAGSIVNIFLNSTTLEWIISFAGIIIFVGLTAYDTQRIKNMSYGADGSEESKKASIMGALTLYLDFINLFLFLLRLLGRRN